MAAAPHLPQLPRPSRQSLPLSPLVNVYTLPSNMQPSPPYYPYPAYNSPTPHVDPNIQSLTPIVPSVDQYPTAPEPLMLADSAYTHLHASHHPPTQQLPRQPSHQPLYDTPSFSPSPHPSLVDPPAPHITQIPTLASSFSEENPSHFNRRSQHLHQSRMHIPHRHSVRAHPPLGHQPSSATTSPHTPHQHPIPHMQFRKSDLTSPHQPLVEHTTSGGNTYLHPTSVVNSMFSEPSVIQQLNTAPISIMQDILPAHNYAQQPAASLAPLQPTLIPVQGIQQTAPQYTSPTYQPLTQTIEEPACVSSFDPVSQHQPPTLLLSQVQPQETPIHPSLPLAPELHMQPVVQTTVQSAPPQLVSPGLPMQTIMGACQYTVPMEMMEPFLAVGLACRDVGRMDLAADAFRACVAICPESSEARNAYFTAMYGQNLYEMSSAEFEATLEVGPVFAEDMFNDVGNTLRSIGRTAEAEMAYRAALNIAPRHAHAWNNLGNAMRARGAIVDAMQCYSASLSCQPGFAAAHCNLAGLLRDQGKPQEAESQYRAALISNPSLAEAAAGLGTALRDMGRTEEAVAYYVRAVSLQPEAADHHANLANTYKDLNRIEESIASYEAALSIQPDLPDAFCNMVHSLSVICDWRNRSQNFVTLLAIIDRQLDALLHNSAANPRLYHTLAGALSNSTPQLVDVCGGSRSDRDCASVSATTLREENSSDLPRRRKYTPHPSSPAVVKKASVRSKFAKFTTSAPSVVAPVLTCGLPSVQPFHALIYPMRPEKFRALSTAYASRAEQMVGGIPHVQQQWTLPRGPRARLKVGYVSSDYNNHPYSHLTQSIYGLHRTGATVECFCYALTPSDNSAWRLRIEREVENFRDISAITAKQSAEVIAKDGIHVLVNCNGYTKGARTELFALRPAPVQVSFMGFPGTLGAHYIEYFITDVVTSPPSLASRMHSEALLYHPHSYFVNDHRQTSYPGPSAFPRGALTRAHYDLPQDCFLFLMHNQLYKLSPDTFDVWARILKRVPNSKIWLLRFPPTGEAKIKAEAAKRGLSQDRLVFTDVAGKDEHVARAGLGDLFLDTPTCNAHTTGTDVLWSGVPMITCPGSLFASRVAASLLVAAGVPELIAADMNEYEDLAVELATNRPRLAAIRAKIESTRYTNALFDTERWVRNVEALYWRAWKNFEDGNEPTHIYGEDVYGGSAMVSRPAAIDSMYSGTESRRSETLVHGRVYSSTVAT